MHLTALREAVARHDWEALAFAAHALKGEASAVGALELRAFCDRLEAYSREGQLTAAQALLAQADPIVDRALSILGERYACVS